MTTNRWPRPVPVNFRANTIYPWFTLSGKDITDSSGAWAAANRIVYCPIWLETPIRTNGIYIVNGSSVAATWIIQIAVYEADSEGKPAGLIQKCLPSVQSGAEDSQLHPFVADQSQYILLGPGLYFIAVILSSTSGTVWRAADITADGLGPACGVYTEDASDTVLPDTATPSEDGVATPLPICYFA